MNTHYVIASVVAVFALSDYNYASTTNEHISTHHNGITHKQGSYISNENITTNKVGKLITCCFSGKTNSILNYDKFGKLNGVQMTWYSNGNLESIVTFSNNVRWGVYRTWYVDGQKECEQWYSNGVLHGDFVVWHNNTQMCDQATYINGKMHGVNTSWDENGIKMTEDVFSNGVAEGVWKSWHPNGILASETPYKNNKEYGVWRYYEGNGTTTRLETYLKNGCIISQMYSNGQPVKPFIYYDQSGYVINAEIISTITNSQQ